MLCYIYSLNRKLMKISLQEKIIPGIMNRPRILYQFREIIRNYYTVNTTNAISNDNNVAKQLFNRIKATGPISLATYMKEVLINPLGGYYMHKNMIGSSGDFITSPELSQMFGEMIAVWCINEWSKTGCPKPFQIVELGPGRGSLCQDILRVFSHFQSLKSSSVALVEASPCLSNIQAQNLCSQSHNITNSSSLFYKEGIGLEGIPIRWYSRLEDVPNIFTIVVAHEFFDALPIHKFQKTDYGYREILIDIGDKEGSFRYIIARNDTPASKAFIKSSESRDHFEISPESLLIIKTIANRLESFGGLALIADYGHCGEGTDTFRAFKKHKLHDPLVEPGKADLTSDVDFVQLKESALEGDKVLVFGPITQRDFLMKMGIEHRYNALEKNASKEQLEALKFSYRIMVDEKHMGKRFKFMSFLPATMKSILDKYPVVGFS